MLKGEMLDILMRSKPAGWVLEPEAKRLFSLAGMDTPRFIWARAAEEAIRFAEEIGYPVVAKVVSPKVVHKSDVNGVLVNIKMRDALIEAYGRLSRIEGFSGILVEEMLSGIELIIGAKIDEQFGPVILLGIGGTGVEIYKDVVLRMAPLRERDTESMMRCLKAHEMLEGYRGSRPVKREELSRLLMTFSNLVMDLEGFIESIDLNPVMCSANRCVVADARIMLRRSA